MKTINDWRGTPIEVGDVILYAVKHSTSVEVNEAVVSEVGERDHSWKTLAKEPYVKAQWQTSSYCYGPNRDLRFNNDRTLKNVTLTNFEGITVVAKHQGPAWSREQDIVAWANAPGGRA